MSGMSGERLFGEESNSYFERMGSKGSAFSSGAVFNFDHLNEDVRRHLKRVYILLTFTVMAASVGSWLASSLFPVAAGSLMLPIFMVSLILLMVLGFTKSTIDNAWWRSSVLVTFGFLQGIAVTPLILQVSAVDPSIPLKAFLLTVVVFVCFSMSALLCVERKFLYLYGVLSTAVLGLAVLTILNIWIQSPFISNVWLYGGLIIFSLFVAVDTQVIIERALRGDSDSVHSALDLFLDLLNIFIRIMIIMSKNKNSSGSKV